MTHAQYMKLMDLLSVVVKTAEERQHEATAKALTKLVAYVRFLVDKSEGNMS